MRRSLLCVIVAAAVAAGAAPAHAKVAKGSFAGKTSADDPVGFEVDKRGRVRGFFYEGVTLTCSDGDTLETPTGTDPARPRVQTPKRVKFRVSKKKKFVITARNAETGFSWDVKASLKRKGRRASGTLKITARFNEDNEQEAGGAITCESQPLTWSARRS